MTPLRSRHRAPPQANDGRGEGMCTGVLVSRKQGTLRGVRATAALRRSLGAFRAPSVGDLAATRASTAGSQGDLRGQRRTRLDVSTRSRALT